MEITNMTEKPQAVLSSNYSFLQVSCNWQVAGNKQLHDAISIVPLELATESISYEDVASVDTCVSLQPADSNAESNRNSNMDSNREPCMLDIKITNCQKIARIAIVSEGSVLEIFKQFGEYETTIFADFIDEYEGTTVFIGEATVQPATTELSIKFTRTRNEDSGTGIWIFGIKLFLTEAAKEAKSGAFNYDIIQTFLSNASGKPHKMADMAKKVLEYCDKPETLNAEQFYQRTLESLTLEFLSIKNKTEERASETNDRLNYENNCEAISSESPNEIANRDGEYPSSKEDNKESDIRKYIDNKFHDMENRLMKRINEIEAITNQKLDAILSKLETQPSLK